MSGNSQKRRPAFGAKLSVERVSELITQRRLSISNELGIHASEVTLKDLIQGKREFILFNSSDMRERARVDRIDRLKYGGIMAASAAASYVNSRILKNEKLSVRAKVGMAVPIAAQQQVFKYGYNGLKSTFPERERRIIDVAYGAYVAGISTVRAFASAKKGNVAATGVNLGYVAIGTFISTKSFEEIRRQE